MDELKRAGKVVEQALDLAIKRVGDVENVLDFVDTLEREIRERGASPAFPVNVGIDNVAAHYTPSSDDSTALSGELIKIDVGAHVDGWIADAAITVPFSPRAKLLATAAHEALMDAVSTIRPGISVSAVGRKIKEACERHGVKPIENLGGHQVSRYSLHAGLFLPNVPAGTDVIEEGMVLAVEPFTTDGRGHVSEGAHAYIFSVVGYRARTSTARQLLKKLDEKYFTLPFAQRWLERDFGKSALLSLYELIKAGSVKSYPVLLEQKGALVAQWETTVVVEPDGAEPLVDAERLYNRLP